MMGIRRVIKRLFGESGQSLVEMALILPVLLLLLLGILEFGIVMGTYLQWATRRGKAPGWLR